MKRDFLLIIYCAVAGASAGLLLTGAQPQVDLKFVESNLPASTVAQTGSNPELKFIQTTGGPPAVHSGTITRLHDGRMLAAWFAGTREGASDVRILMSSLTPGASEWSEPTTIATREQTAKDLNRYIAKLGNPILFADSRQRIWLFYVTVSMGGWSGSSITLRYSDDDGVTWTAAQRLVTSPFLNFSTLVKGCPIECETGHLLLPVYHEFISKFGEALIINPEGKLVSKLRLTAEPGAIQPWIVPIDRHASQAFYRQSGHHHKLVLANHLDNVFDSDCGSIEFTNIPNPNSAIAVIRRDNGEFLMASNPLEFGRHKLSLATSNDGLEWKVIRDVEVGDPPDEFSYPYLIQTARGEYHLVYTWNRTRIRYVAFDEQWLEMNP
ncbi:MAG TPA: exo-alpha-sialidase [Planctomycetaceae bacterium]|mgnify:CR=1 FL=1|nr:exo-alpha-sialidase [Planctomycetaceae bacterium]